MTDKELKAKILAEIERMIDKYHFSSNDYEAGKKTGLLEFKTFIKSLPEEPISEDLEEAAKKYYPILRDDKGDYLRDAFKAGAQWQKEQMVKNVVLETKVYLESDGDGIESEHQEWLALENNEILDIPNNIGLKDGDKVKVIIIKEEETVR